MTTSAKRSIKKQPRRIVTIIFISAGIIIAGLCILFACLFLQANHMTNTMTDEVNSARAEMKQKVSEQRQTSLATYANQHIIKDTQPMYSSSVDACYLAHNDSGWTIDSHYQQCYLRYVDVFNTDLTEDQYLALSASTNGKTSNLEKLRTQIKTCSDDRSRLGSAETTEIGFTKADGSDKICSLPNQIYGNRVVAYAVNDVVSEQKITGNINQVTGQKNNIIIVADYSYYKKDLGCKPFSFMCAEPISSPVVGNMKEKK